MAPLSRIKRGPQQWTETKKNSSVASTVSGKGARTSANGACNPLEASSEDREMASTPSTSARAPKKIPPPVDACEEVLAEHAAASRRSSSSLHANCDSSARPRSTAVNTEGHVDVYAPTDQRPLPNHWRKEQKERTGVTTSGHEDADYSHSPSPAGAAMGMKGYSDRPREDYAEHYDLSSDDGIRRYDSRREQESCKRRADDMPSPYRSDDMYERRSRHRPHRHRSRSRSYSPRSPHSNHRRRVHGSRSRKRDDSMERRGHREYEIPSKKEHSRSRRESHGSGGSSRRRGRSASPITPPPTRSGASSGLIYNSRGEPILMKKESETTGDPNMTSSVKLYKHGSQISHSSTVNRESILRQERREREIERESVAQHRESCGKKPHLINVSFDGKPYGYGVTVWNDVLAKVVRGLDPSYIDIRQQPCHLMDTMLKRLHEEFEYTDKINSAWLRGRIGNALSSYRHELMKMITAEESRPPWVSETIWEKLVTLHSSEKFKQKSAAMRYAQSCRHCFGRTGPIGEVGVTERLRKKLGRSPAPDEVYKEMQRDKGFGGRCRKASVTSNPSGTHNSTEEDSVIEPAHQPDHVRRDAERSAAELPLVLSPGRAAEIQVNTNVAPVGGRSMADSPVNPLVTLLQKQIDEILASPVVGLDEGQSLISTLRSQLVHLQGRSHSSGHVVNAGTSELHSPVPSGAHTVPDNDAAAQAGGTHLSHPLQVNVTADDADLDDASETVHADPKPLVPTRKSGRKTKKKVRTDSVM